MVAFSGGVDSSYLAWEAHQTLGENALAVTAESVSYPASHRKMAEQIVRDFQIAHRFVKTHEMESADYRSNRPDRCYHCKTELFDVLGDAHCLGRENAVRDHDFFERRRDHARDCAA